MCGPESARTAGGPGQAGACEATVTSARTAQPSGPGIPALRPHKYKGLKNSHRTVARAYGGRLCAACTKGRVLRAFIVEEHQIVRKVISEKNRKA